MTTETTSDEAFLLLDEARPTFAEPWEAQVFSLVVELNRQGLFTWSDWASRLAFEISRAKDRATPTSVTPIMATGWLHSSRSYWKDR